MSRMIPAKIRSVGAEFYKDGQVTDVAIANLKLTANVAGESVVYDLDGEADNCACPAFQSNFRYCPHIAAVEEYLKNEKEPATEVSEILKNEKGKQEKSKLFSRGSAFLHEINRDLFREDKRHFCLGVEIVNSTAVDAFESAQDFLVVSFKICEDKGKHFYVIRDIPSFLGSVRRHENYMLGQFYLPDLSFENFDEASQALLNFLYGLEADSSQFSSINLYRKSGRYLLLPHLLLENFLNLVAELDSHELNIGGQLQKYWAFADLDETADVFHFEITALEDSVELSFEEAETFALYQQHCLYSDNTFYRLTEKQIELIKMLGTLPDRRISFSYDDKDGLAQSLQVFSSLGPVKAPEAFKIHDFQARFEFSMKKDRLVLKLAFVYEDFEVSSFRELETLEFSRNLRLEKKIFDLMKLTGFPRAFESSRHPLEADELYDFYEVTLPAFEKLGEVRLDEILRSQELTAEPEISVSTHGNLLDVSFSLPELEEPEYARVLKALKSDANYYVTKSGKLVKFDDRFTGLKEVLTNFEDAKLKDRHIETAIFRSFAISKIFEDSKTSTFDEKFQQLYKDLTHPEQFPFEKPQALKAALRHYQEDGVRWMTMLTHYGMSGILADDMGLGKTLQAITFLLSELTEKKRALIVAPSSLIYNWADEFEKFAPQALNVQIISGSKEERSQLISDNHQVYITSYGSFLKDEKDYQTKKFDCLLLDEAQVVKNFNSKTNKALTRLSVEHIFALSGTPIENRLDELWAIFNILMPGLLPARKNFNKLRPDNILKMIKPFVMRRKKEEVLSELPDKFEITQLSELTDQQKVIYLSQLEAMQKRVLGMTGQEFNRSRVEILAGITRLRQICDTPALFLPDYTDSSSKLDSLDAILQQVKDSGRRPLIFSQFTSLFPHIEKLLLKHGLTSYKLTGSTLAHERIERVRAFNAGSRDVFLISLKAGGTGLNLASSDMVILIDIWWNPAVEEQAISRAHRMGQKKRVEVIRLITKGTIEEKIVEIQKRKKDLFSAILDSSSSSSSLTQADINEILGINA